MQETCLTCHKDKTAEQMNKAIDAMKGHYDGKVREAEARMNDMFDAFELAIASGVMKRRWMKLVSSTPRLTSIGNTGRPSTVRTSTIPKKLSAASPRVPSRF